MDFFGIFLIFPPENGVSGKKVQKNWNSKNGFKAALTPLFKELWAIFSFVKFKNQISPPPRKTEKALGICRFSIENPAIFCHFRWQKYTCKSIDFSIFGRDFGRILDILSYYTDGFFSSIFDFFPKKTDFQVKNFKNTESPKMVLKRLYRHYLRSYEQF